MTQTEARKTTTTARGFTSLPCLKCGEAGQLTIALHDLTGDEAIKCGSCDAEYGMADVEATLKAWERVRAWIAMAPAAE